MTTKVLLVEDELLIGKNIQLILAKNNIECRQVLSGEEAISIMAAYQPDLILMDISLKGELTGIETAIAIQKKHSVPMIYATEHPMNSEHYKNALKTIPQNYLTKPFKNSELLKSIELALLQWQSRSPSQPVDHISAKENDHIFIWTIKNAYERLYFRDIAYLQAAGAYTHIYYTSAKKADLMHYTVSLSSNHVFSQLAYSSLIKVHRSYYVNIEQVDSIYNGSLKMSDAEIPVSETYREELLRRVNKFSFKGK